jgi:hypothetical protein
LEIRFFCLHQAFQRRGTGPGCLDFYPTAS